MSSVERRAMKARKWLALLVLVGGSGINPEPLRPLWAQPAISSRLAPSQSPGQWSMHMNGPRRLGRSPFLGPQTSGKLWQYPIVTDYGGAVIGRSGTIYMGALSGDFFAFRPDGTVKWSVAVPGSIGMTPAILLDRRIAFVNSQGTLYVVNPDGSRSWQLATGNGCSLCPDSSPAIGADGTIYFGQWETVYALDPNGSLKWSFHIPDGFRVGGPVSVGSDGVVYFPSNYLYALNPDGTVKWHSVDEFAPGGSPAIASDGTIYVNSSHKPPTVRAFNSDGSLRWAYEVAECCGPDVAATPAIATDGTIYVGELVLQGTDIVGTEVALNPDGTLRWKAEYGTSPTSASIGADGTIYFGSGSHDPGQVYALNPDGTLRWQFDDVTAGYIRTPPAIGKGQRLYAGSIEGFFAIGP